MFYGMSSGRPTAVLALAAALAWPAIPASAAPHAQPTAVTITPTFAETLTAGAQSQASDAVEVAQYNRAAQRQRRAYRAGRRDGAYAQRRRDRVRHNGRYYYYRNGGYYDNTGAALAAGVIGLAAGAVLGSALANSAPSTTVVVDPVPVPYSAEWYRRCDLKYRSFRASDGTYLGYDGVRHTCRLP